MGEIGALQSKFPLSAKLNMMADQGQFLGNQDDCMNRPHAMIVTHTPGPLNQLVEILEPTGILNNYIDQVNLQFKVWHLASSVEEMMRVDQDSIHHPENYSSGQPPPFIYGTAHCASCAMMQASDTRPRCDPPAFLLPSSTESPITALVAPFKILPHYQRPPNGHSVRCDQESLVISFSLRDCYGNDIATYQMGTQLKPRTLPASQPHQPVQPNFLDLLQANRGHRSIEMTNPPPPRIVDINPQFGPYFANQRVWLKVKNLPRGGGLHYLVGFGGPGVVDTSFVSSEGDQVQILECTTPIASAPCLCFPSLMRHYDPQIPIGFSDVYYEFNAQP